MAEHLNTKAPLRRGMEHLSKWDVIDRFMRLVVYIMIIYVIFKMFQVPVP
jgi:hypothetical protein